MIGIRVALLMYIVLALSAAFALHGSARILVWLVVGLLAVKSGLHHWRTKVERRE